jgi:hypothetical protein
VITTESTKTTQIRSRALIGAVAAAACLVLIGTSAPQAEAATACIWGDTPAAPTGEFTIKPGLTWTPAAGPLNLRATGPAKGDACKDTVTFEGVVRAGSTCGAIVFEGVVKGVPGVERFWGPGNVIAHEFLYDRDGELVGFNDPSVVNQDLVEQILGNPNSCNTPEGFTHGRFSSIITLFE